MLTEKEKGIINDVFTALDYVENELTYEITLQSGKLDISRKYITDAMNKLEYFRAEGNTTKAQRQNFRDFLRYVLFPNNSHRMEPPITFVDDILNDPDFPDNESDGLLVREYLRQREPYPRTISEIRAREAQLGLFDTLWKDYSVYLRTA